LNQGFKTKNFFFPLYRFQEEGIEVDIASPELISDPLAWRKGKYGIPFQPNRTTKNLMSAIVDHNIGTDTWDIVYVPGGWESPEKIRQDEHSLKFIKKMFEAGKLICALCHGPWVLISAGIMKGRKGTCFKGMKDDLISSGCEYIDAPVVVDGNIITAPHYRNNPDFMREVIKASKNTETDPYAKFSA
jgi:protease I